MKLTALLAAAMLTGSLFTQSASAASGYATKPIFGRASELHLSPSYGPLGTNVTAIGLGYSPGARVALRYGAPNAEYVSKPILSTTVAPNGTFRVTFRVTCALTRVLVANRSCKSRIWPLIMGAFQPNGTPSRGTATTAFIATY